MLGILVGLGTSDLGSPLHWVPHVDREDERVVFKPFALFGNQPHFHYRSTPDQPKRGSGNPEQYTRAMINSKGRLAVPQCYSQ